MLTGFALQASFPFFRYVWQVFLLEDLHREVISEARARGLNYRQMAEEFNERGIRRRDGQPWTARDIKRRWGGLNELKRKREQKGLNTTDLVDVQKSA